jgi:hypothetical protein
MSTSWNRLRRSPLLACAILVALTVILPEGSQAQFPRRRPVIGPGAPPTRPAPLPPQPAAIRRDLRYRFSKFSSETYSMFEATQVDRYPADSGAASYGMQGEGVRLDYRYRPTFSFTGDIASTFFGGPFSMQRVQLGGRYHPDRLEYHVRPFVDLRGSWAHTIDAYAQPVGNSILVGPYSGQYLSGWTTSNGFGAFVGGGMDYSIMRNIAITTELGLARHRLGDVSVSGTRLGSSWDYNATTASFIIGLKYTGGRYVVIQDPMMARQK